MRIIQDAFTIIHIQISGHKLFGINLRHFIALLLILFLITNTIRLFITVINGYNPIGFLEGVVLIIGTIYTAMYWVLAWPKAGEMLNKASDYEAGHAKMK